MPRLPTIGEQPYGPVFLDWLLVAHNADGSLKNHAPVFNVKDYGAKGDGVTNDTAAIQAADAAARAVGGYTFLPAGEYKANLSARSGSRFLGAYGDLLNNTLGTKIVAFNDALDVIKVDQGAGNYQSNISLENLSISGGFNGFATYHGLSFLSFRNVQITGNSNAQFYIEDWIEEVDFDFVRLVGGTYGFRHAGLGSGLHYIDKATFNQLYCAGASKNGWNTVCQFDGVTWIQPNITSNGEHGFVLDGATNALTFIGLSTEGNGTTGKSNRTTGSITSGTPTLTVASAAGWANGDKATIRGALGFNGDLTANVINVVGTTITLDANAAATVAAVPSTNAPWDDMVFTNAISGGSGPGDIVMIGCFPGGEAAGHLRYAINAALCSKAITLIGSSTANGNVPVYDPLRLVTALTCHGLALRRPLQMNGWEFRGIVSDTDPVEPTPTLYGGSRGQDMIFGLPDSIGNGAGTFGKYSFRFGDANKTEAVSFDRTRLTAIGNITASDGVTTKYLSGAGKTTVVDADFTATPANGSTAVHFDTTAGKAYFSVRANGAWKVMAGPI